MSRNESKIALDALKKQLGGKSVVPKNLSGITCRPEILLCDNIPAPLHGVAPRVVLGTKWWNTTRQAAYKSTNYHCLACGVHKSGAQLKQHMEGHEVYDINYETGRMVYVETVPLCHFCHCYIHDGRLTGLLNSGKISHSLFAKIIQHGDSVLSMAGLSRLPRRQREANLQTLARQGKLAPWDQWRMQYKERVFKPKTSLVEMLLKAFHQESVILDPIVFDGEDSGEW